MPTFVTSNMVFLHVPKTGGTWVTQAVQAAGVAALPPSSAGARGAGGDPHTSLSELSAGERLSVAFVRHPLDWWRSYWGHRMRAGWLVDSSLDRATASEDFNEFIGRVVEHCPGTVDGLVRRFIGSPTAEVAFVGRFEHLLEDTCMALTLSGERFSLPALRAHPRENTNDYTRFTALYRPEVAERLAAAEHETIERFYPEDPLPAHLLLDRAGEQQPTARELDARRLQEQVRGLGRALERARSAETQLNGSLTRERSQHAETAAALAALRESHLVRGTRPLRLGYYRVRRGLTSARPGRR